MSKEPIEQRIIGIDGPNGMKRNVGAINEAWCESRSWSNYQPPPSNQELQQGAKDYWISRAEAVEADLVWLLQQPCNKFWSQVLYDNLLQKFLEDCLQHYTRDYDRQSDAGAVLQVNENILHKLFLVYLRVCTYKESASDYFSPTYYANLIYDNFIVDIPKIIDMCSLFRTCNREIAGKMVENVFKVQPKYAEDLFSTGVTLGKAMENAGEQYQTLRMSMPSRANVDGLFDVIEFITDICSSTFSLVDIYPAASTSLQLSDLESKLATFYHSTIVGVAELFDTFTEKCLLADDDIEYCSSLIQLSRHRAIMAFRRIVDYTCITPIFQDKNNDHCGKDEAFERFLAIFTTILQERTFLLDYNSKFSVSDDFDFFTQTGIYIDPTRKMYILDALCAESRQESIFSSVAAGVSSAGEKEKQSVPVKQLNSVSPSTSPPLGATALSGPDDPTVRPSQDVEVDSMISSVRDLLPYLGEGFVHICLQHYQFKVDEVVNAILEGNLAPHLAEMDQSMPRKIEIEPTSHSAPAVEMPKGRGVYDNDEFDINTRDVVDLSRIHRGKRNKGDFKKLIDDKTDINSMRERFSKLGIVTDVETVGIDTSRDYEDEYDDTYDDLAVGQEEPDSRDDGVAGRNFVLPVALGGGKIGRVVPEEDDDEEEDEEEDTNRKNMNFVRNPEEVRQEKERRRQEKISRQGHKRTPAHQPVKDVVGKPKGQGQDKQVLINRARKNANKGKSQRAGADRKQAKGMF